MTATTPGGLTLRWQGCRCCARGSSSGATIRGALSSYRASKVVERTFSWFAQSASRPRLRETLATFVTLVSTQLARRNSLGRRLPSAIHHDERRQIGL